jgi:hypothetical protein
MSQHQITVERPWENIPTKQLINTETGQTEVFVKNPPFSDIKVAQSGANNQWEITDKNELLKRYNNKNSINITEQELNKKFFTDGTKQFNNDRAAVINKNSPENTKTFLATKENPVPGTVDPKTGIKATQTAPTTASDPGTTPVSGAIEFAKNIEDRAGTRNNFPQNLVYPADLAQKQQDVIKFSMIKFEPKKLNVGNVSGLGGFSDRRLIGNKPADRKAIGIVVLPIPNGISDTNACNWGDGTMNPAEALLANLALTTIKSGFGAGVEALQSAGDQAQQNSGDLAKSLIPAFAAAAIGQPGAQLLQRTEGAVFNPNLELLFNGPSLRPFNFTFKLASRSPAESKTIRSIIRFFKQGMSPIRSQSQLFLKAPHTFQIQYLHRGEEHKFLNQFKECALQSFNVSYTPEGQYATFNDGAMVSYQITMQFQELEPIFNDDYTNDGTNLSPNIGF